jgi:hypothetical protein
VLDDLGEEVTGVLAPVSACMAIVVLLVRALNPDGGSGGAATVAIASLAYNESVRAAVAVVCDGGGGVIGWRRVVAAEIITGMSSAVRFRHRPSQQKLTPPLPPERATTLRARGSAARCSTRSRLSASWRR